MGTSGINWRNVPHEEIIRQINGGAGVAGVADLPAGYRQMAETLRQADADLRAALASSGASWEGVAADEMQTAATPLAQWADEADRLASESSVASSVYGDEYATTRTGMPTPVPIPSGGLFESVVSGIPGVTTDRERAEAAADAAHEEAAARMETYDNASYSTVQTQYFSPPPQVVLEIAPTTDTGGATIGGTTSTYGGSSSGGAATTPSGYSFVGGGSTAASFVGPTGSPTAPTAPTVGGPAPTWQAPGTVAPTGPSTVGTQTPYPPVGTGAPLPPGTSTQYPTSGGTGARRPAESAVPPPIVPPGGRPGPGGTYVPGTYGPGGTGPGGYGPGGYGARGGVGGPGFGGGPGGFGPGSAHGAGFGAGLGADEASRNAAARGGLGAFVGDEAAAGRAAAAGMRPGAAGAGAGYGSMAGGAGRREDDAEHRRPDYLVETEDVWGDGTRVAPPVIGERPGL